jgi:ornithine cyclodeaminase/alanine dehydrogenase-like protein (mu-crystallin family)
MKEWELAGNERAVRLFNDRDVARGLDLSECIDGVEESFRALAEDGGGVPPPVSVHVPGGAYHVKVAAWAGVFAAKVNANFPGNAARGQPTIRGLIAVFEEETGRPIAVLESGELTARRTAAATGVAIKHLALAGPQVVTLCGCGRQGGIHLDAVAAVRPIERVFLCDVRDSAARALAEALAGRMDVTVISPAALFTATRESQLVITCTTATEWFLAPEAVGPGTLIAAVGADNPAKQEVSPVLMQQSRVVTDLTDQCALLGDLRHAMTAGVMTRERVHAELGQVVAGGKPGRESEDDIIVFDSTGIAVQDAVAVRLLLDRR